MTNSFLYKIGMNGECFGLMKLFQWILYALYHASVIFIFSFIIITQQDAIERDGQVLGFFVAGHVVYGACVIIANLILFMRFHTHTQIGHITFFLSIAAYFVFFLAES